ncbi:hypothetical protein [Microvirga pakistanensis]|uniref:hypothetical protein n=1 Tax=Microvirga pakistanensis TaxID=1682650 RepID=UPI00106D99FC|nr:hypothetical protein [Microvirga pakistanensis]
MSEDESNCVMFYPSKAVQDVLSTNPTGNISDRINDVCEQHQDIVRFYMPSFQVNEWMAMIDCWNSTIRNATLVHHLEHSIRDAIDLDDLAGRWNFNGDDLCNRLQVMGVGERIAIIEVVNRYWSAYGGKTVDAVEALQAVGAKINR